nr:immunoglobulin light chain junction region [Macaca mulatta]
CLNGYGFPLTF